MHTLTPLDTLALHAYSLSLLAVIAAISVFLSLCLLLTLSKLCLLLVQRFRSNCHQIRRLLFDASKIEEKNTIRNFMGDSGQYPQQNDSEPDDSKVKD